MADGSSPGPRVFDEEDFRRLLAWEIQRATRYQDFLSLCLARPDHPGAPSRETLDAMARRVLELLRSTDLVGLLGDSLAIILVHTPGTDAIVITERVRDLLEAATFPAGGSTAAVSSVLRLGLASFPTDATSDTVLLEQAQARLTAPGRGAHGSRQTS
jgi:PleD family two-component response regulator